MSDATCLNCGSSEIDKPLLVLKFQGKEVNICPQCMPILIHKPQQLGEKLPGLGSWDAPADHDH